MGIAGAGLVLVWAYGLLKSTGRVLLDAEMDAPVVAEIREVIAASPVPAEITDMHVWRVASGKSACRSEARRVGQERDSPCRTGWVPEHCKQKYVMSWRDISYT